MDNRTIEQVRDNETIWINKAIKLEEENKQLKEKIDKAIEYIKTCNDKEKLESMFLDESYISNYGAKELLEILGDKE